MFEEENDMEINIWNVIGVVYIRTHMFIIQRIVYNEKSLHHDRFPNYLKKRFYYEQQIWSKVEVLLHCIHVEDEELIL